MALNQEQQGRLLRHLNGELSSGETTDLNQLLKENAEARSFLRGVAEQAVVVADVERLAQQREPAKVVRPVFNPVKWAVAATIILILAGSFLFSFQSADRGLRAEVVATHGPNQHLASDGVTLPALMPGVMLKIGDKLRTLSSRSWVNLKLNDGSHVILSGRSSMRLIHDENHRAFLLRYGNLWATINTPEGVRPVSILTETARLKTTNAQFDVETKFEEISVINVNKGSVSTERLSDASQVDVVADQTIIPEENQRHYSEKIAYLPSYQVNDSNQSSPSTTPLRQDLGLPEKEFVFCCFNSNYKITPTTFDSWARILKQVDDSVLLIYISKESARINLTKEIVLRGIQPSRLIFAERVPMPEYLARYRVADLFLDTHPYNAGTTASDALRMGLPVLP